MLRETTVCLVLALALGCTKKEAEQPAEPAATESQATLGPAEWKAAPLGGALNTTPESRAKSPAVAGGTDGVPVVAWNENGQILVRSWNGSTWEAMGEPLNRNPPKGGEQPQIAVQPDGSIHVAWRENDPANDYSRVQVSRWSGSAWEPVGDVVTPAGSTADSVRIAAAPEGVVVVTRERIVPATERQLIVRRWNGSTWQQLGGGALNAVAGSDISVEPALTTLPAGDIVVAWIERTPGQPAAAKARRWDQTQNLWIDLPPVDGVDGDTTLSMAATSELGVVLSRTWNVGLRPLLELIPLNTTSWSERGLPDAKLRSAAGPSHLVATAPNGSIVMISSASGNLRVDALDGPTWSPITAAVNPEPTRGWEPAVAVGSDGTIYVAYIDTRNEGAQLLVVSYQR